MFLIPWKAVLKPGIPPAVGPTLGGVSKICFAPAPHQSFSTLSQVYRSREGRKTRPQTPGAVGGEALLHRRS